VVVSDSMDIGVSNALTVADCKPVIVVAQVETDTLTAAWFEP
jgi:hypothetical protein